MTAETVPQHMAALETAQATIHWRAGVKTVLACVPHREGRLVVAALLVRRVRPGRVDHLASLPVFKLLDWIFRWEASKTAGVLDRAGIASQTRSVGELTDRQRHALAEALTDAERVG